MSQAGDHVVSDQFSSPNLPKGARPTPKNCLILSSKSRKGSWSSHPRKPEGANAALDLFAMVFSSVVEISFTPFYAVGLLVNFLSSESKPCADNDD
jgi:hypothetical protein